MSTLADTAAALRGADTSAVALLRAAFARRDARRPPLDAYIWIDPSAAFTQAQEADERLREPLSAPPLCGVPISVKDLYGVAGQPIWAGTATELPPAWATDGWLVSRLRRQGAVFTGRTHTVELAFGAVGTNPHHGTPRNPYDDVVHRIPGGSSAGAGVSLVEGSAQVALGTDTGGSIRIPASLSGTVGLKTTRGRWPTDGVVPLSTSFDTVGALTRSVADAAWFFGAVDPARGDPEGFLAQATATLTPGTRAPGTRIRIGRPRCALRGACQRDIGTVVDDALGRLERSGAASLHEADGALLDEAERHYMEGTVVAAECRAFLDVHLPGRLDLLDPRVAARLRGAPHLDAPRYRTAVQTTRMLAERAPTLFDDVDLLAWPTHLVSPPPLAELDTLSRYLSLNSTLLRPTCPVNVLGLCALTLPVGHDTAGFPVGLQLVAPGGADERLLSMGLHIESILAMP